MGLGGWTSQEKAVDEESSLDGLSDETLQDIRPTPEGRLTKIRHLLSKTSLSLLPSPVLRSLGYHIRTTQSHSSNTAYLDGMRGVASWAVFNEHFAMRYHPHMFEEYDGKPWFFQWPVVRLLYSGSVMVAIFFVISGFALSLRPLEIIHERDWERLYHTIASATFRRGIRIFLPPIAIVFMVMVGVRFHLYDQRITGATDMNLEHPHYAPTFWLQIIDALEYILGKLIFPAGWLKPLPNITESDYAAPLYTIPQEFWSSMFLFATIIGLSRVKSSVRIMGVLLLLWGTAWCMRREISAFLAGMVIAELHLRKQQIVALSLTPPRIHKLLSTSFWVLVFVAGLWLASIPHTHGSYGSSTWGYVTISKLIPWNSNLYNIGAVLIVWGVSNLPWLQKIFTLSVSRYLGEISFALYLVHWPLVAAFGWNLVPAVWRFTGSSTIAQYETGWALSYLFILPIVLWISDLFWRFVDMPCIRFAKQFEKQLSVEKHM